MQALRGKSAMKQDVFKATEDLFELLKKTLEEVAMDLAKEAPKQAGA